MKPLIVVATRMEIQDSISLLEEKGIPYIITNVGMTATAFALGKHIGKGFNSSWVLNVGIAGSLDKNIPLGSVGSISSDTFYELGAEDGDTFLSIDELGFGEGMYHAIDPHPNLVIDLPKWDAITVNKVHGSERSIQKLIQQHPHIKVESMEGAAIFYSCMLENIPSAQVRAISNYVERRDKSKWNMGLAIKNLNDWLKLFITTNY